MQPRGILTTCCFTKACGKFTIRSISLLHFAAMRLNSVPGIQSGTCRTDVVKGLKRRIIKLRHEKDRTIDIQKGRMSTIHTPACPVKENCDMTSSASWTSGSCPLFSVVYPCDIFNASEPTILIAVVSFPQAMREDMNEKTYARI